MDEKLMEFIKQCEEKLKTIQNDIEPIKNDVMNFIQDKFLSISVSANTLLHGRVKSPISLREKIIRKNYYIEYVDNIENLINDLPDLIGVRIVCLLDDEEAEIYQELKTMFSERITESVFIIPDSDESKHLRICFDEQPQTQKNSKKIYKLNCIWVDSEKQQETSVELQIKCLTHLFWGEIEHMLFYKNYSYIIGADFYRKIMDSTYDILKLVDFQLNIIKYQLNHKDEPEQIEEIKEMLAKLIYNNYGPRIKNLLGCEIDLREIYDVIVQIYLLGATSLEDAYNRTNQIINELNRFKDLTQESFVFIEYDRTNPSTSAIYRPLSIIIDDLAKSTDVYWKALVGIFMILTRSTNYTETIDKIGSRLMSSFNAHRDYIENNEYESLILAKTGIIHGIINAFDSYRKLDFFLLRGYTPSISKLLIKFVENNQDLFEIKDDELTEYKKNLLDLVRVVIRMQICFVLDGTISNLELIYLNELLKNELPWKPATKCEMLERYIGEGKTMNGKEICQLFEIDEN